MADATKRMNFFDRQFLRAPDFQDEQAYQMDRRRRHNRLLHTPGIAEGLQVNGNVGETFVSVTSGTAYDELGQEMILAAQQVVDVSKISGATAFITIAYSEQPSDLSSDPGVTGKATRWSEIPALAAGSTSPANPNLTLLLATVPLANGKVSDTPDNTVRTHAGTVVGAGELSDVSGIAPIAVTSPTATTRKVALTPIMDADVAASAAIAPTKIAGTAATLGANSFSGNQSFSGNTTTPLVTVTQSGTTGNPVGLSVSAIGAAVDGTGIVGLRGSANAPGGFGIVGNAVPGATAGQFNGDVAVTGKVGIGTAAPASPLHVADHVTVGLFPSRVESAVGRLEVSGPLAELGFIRRNLNAFPANPAAGDRFVWYNSEGTARLWTEINGDLIRVTPTGTVGIGTQTISRSLHVEGSEIHSGGGGGGFSFADRTPGNFVEAPTKGERWVWYATQGQARLWSGGDKVRVTTDGLVHASGFAADCDARFKAKIKPLSKVLEKLEKINGISFEWNKLYASLGRSKGRREIGLLAQDVEAVFPEVVHTWGEEGYKAVDYGRLTAVLLEAVKELQAANKVLEERVEALEGEAKKGKPRPRSALDGERGA